ncbi:MAG: glycosyltransferase [Candidatus Aegiribacteria sp.]|nr:glycosyltransferase [Candidatus Aegiribacteria sp.]MBD3294494.1 glycosyltransferase [Candidatus Fermentibacteria bacterium]
MDRKVKVSGFTFVRDAIRLDYPIVESIKSALPIVDEYVVNVGDCTDNTMEAIRNIDDPKIKVIETEWNPDRFVAGATNADQTNIALEHCTNPWCLYLQADEVIHEEDFGRITGAMEKYDSREDVDGLLFHYNHFWGSYSRVHRGHNWYDREIRVIKNGRGIRSWKSAQSFRKNGEKLRVADCGAWIYHYGWVRHPEVMRKKQIALDSLHHDEEWVKKRHEDPGKPWDYGPLDGIPLFRDTHPAVMQERIQNKSWKAEVYTDPGNPPDHEHLRLWCRFHSFLEKLIGRKIGGYSNWVLVD